MTDEPSGAAIEELALEAGLIILGYSGQLAVEDKLDGTPVTEADFAANRFLTAELTARWPYPVVSEESPLPPWEERQRWHRHWLIDPLDGTRDFLAGTGEYGVNIALIEDGRPLLGAIAAPALGVAWSAARGQGAWKSEGGRKRRLAGRSTGKIIGLKSRFRSTAEVDRFLAQHGVEEVQVVGSTIKLCLIAEGAADLYMSLGRTKEWDTAPGQLLVEETGGGLFALDGDRQPLAYNRPDPVNPALVVCSERLLGRLQNAK